MIGSYIIDVIIDNRCRQILDTRVIHTRKNKNKRKSLMYRLEGKINLIPN